MALPGIIYFFMGLYCTCNSLEIVWVIFIAFINIRLDNFSIIFKVFFENKFIL